MKGGPDYEVRDCAYETPCWVWLKSRMSAGYGQYTKRDGLRGGAHRAYYQLHVGPIPPDREVHHLCENKLCVNPEHLTLVTRAEHARMGKSATKTHCIHGHPLGGDNLYVDPRGRRQCKTCRREALARHRARAEKERV